MLEKDLVLHLIGEIADFILGSDTNEMVISLWQEPEGVHLSVMDDHPRTSEDIERITLALNSQKRPELAGYYGSMTGHDMLGGSRLDLVGWQVKNATVHQVANGIQLDIWIGSDDFIPDRKSRAPKET